ncbi:MAG: TonB-dependent siderophore receptor [Methylotenera sp.]
MIIKIILVAVLAALPLLAQAEHDETIHLDEISVMAPKDDTGYTVINSTSATRTDTSIKETPQSIIVVNRNVIDDQQSVTLSEALRNVSGVRANSEFSTPAFDSTLIRGFAAEQLLDGYTQYYNTGDREGLVNVERIEVLKGANAVLYSGGSGAPVGGVVNIASKKPNAKASGELGIKVGSFGFVQPFFDVNQPLSENVLFRITGEYTKADSYIDVIDQKRYNFNPALTLTNNDDTTITLQGKRSRWVQQEYQGLPATGTVAGSINIKDDLFIGNKDVPDSYSEFNGIWATLDHKFNDVWTANANLRYAESKFEENVQSIVGADSFSANVPAIAPSTWGLSNVLLDQSQTEKSIVLNTTAKFDLGITKNTVLLGADYTELKDLGVMTSDAFIAVNAVDLTNPVFTVPYIKLPKSPFTTFFDSSSKNTTYGAYVQLQSTIAERLHMLAALRQAHVANEYTELAGGFSKTKTEKNKLLPRLGAVLDITKVFSIFANYSEGMRAQTFTFFAPGVTPAPAESENKEIGFKFDVNNELSGQFALFHIDRTNVVVGFPATVAGEQRSKGFDTDITWHPSPAWDLLANYAYTDAEFSNDEAGVPAGNKLAGVPKNTARLWANYNFQQDALKGLSAGVGANWQSEAYIDTANAFKADSFYTVDATVAYQTPRYNLGLTIKNLTNQDYFQFYNYFNSRVAPDTGTTAYLSASFKY